MKSGKKIKRDTQIIILSVLILTIISLNFSYSAFFSIDSGNTVKEISTGTLNVTASTIPMAKTEVFPTEEVLPTTEKATLQYPEKDCASLTISNNGNIDANYTVSLSYDLDSLNNDHKENSELVSFENLIIGVQDTDNNSWLNLNPNKDEAAIYNMKVTQFTSSEPNVYPILKGEIGKAQDSLNPTKQNLKVYVWLSDTTSASEIGKYVYLKLNVKSIPAEGQQES